MSKRANNKLKKKKRNKWLISILVIVLILAALLFGTVQIARWIVANNTAEIISQIVPTEITGANTVQITASSPEDITKHLNDAQEQVVARSRGFVDSAKASTDGTNLFLCIV
ncbi:MAG: hypothetical protein LBV67_03835 [Streptococcaceae bacterium]|jgi:predicted PurR-regulated permease PerM|nr:hypothetical protein [Streptococcaceae bacterium]